MIGLILFPCIFLGTHLVLLIWKLMSFGSGNLCDFLCAKLSLLSELSVFWVFDSRDSSSDFLIPSLLCFSHPFALISIDCLTVSSGSTELLISAVIFLVSQSSFFFFFSLWRLFLASCSASSIQYHYLHPNSGSPSCCHLFVCFVFHVMCFLRKSRDPWCLLIFMWGHWNDDWKLRKEKGLLTVSL